MRPIKLIIQAIGPFADRTEVDFSLLDNGLFLIAGATGSGKSTLFDAIAYALFGERSAESRRMDPSMLVSQFADPETEPFVEFTFSHQGGVYRVLRSLEWNRPKKRGSGTTKVASTAALWRPDGSVVEMVRPVGEAVERLLGVDAGQFRQLYMLPQGEFARILNATSGERQEIFRSVFGTAYIERFTDDLKNRASEARTALERVNQKMLAAAASLPPVELLEDAAEIHTAVAEEDAHKLLLWLPELTSDLTHLNEHYEALITEVKLAAAQDLASEQQLKRAERDEDAFTEHEKALKAQAEIKGEEARFAQDEAFWRTAKRAKEEVRPAYESYRDVHERLLSEDKRVSELASEAKEADERLQSTLAAEKKLLASRPDLEGDRERLGRLKAEVEAHVKLKQIDSAIKENEQHLLKAESSAAAASKLAVERKDALTALRAEQEGFTDSQLLVKDLLREKETLSEAKQKVIHLGNALERRGELAEQLGQASEELRLALERRTRIEQAFYDGQAGLLAKRLTDGEPCLVCGSTNHPRKAVLPDESVNRTAVKDAVRQEKEASEKSQKLSSELSIQDVKNAELTASIAKLLGGNYSELALPLPMPIRNLSADIHSKQQDQQSRLVEAIKRLEQLQTGQKKIAELEREEEKSGPAAKALNAEMEKCRISIGTLKGERVEPQSRLIHASEAEAKAAFTTLDRALMTFEADKQTAGQAKDKAMTDASQASAKLNEMTENLEKTKLDFTSKKTRFLAALAKGSFDSEADFLAALLEDDAFQALEEQIATFRRKKETAARDLKLTEEKISGKTRPDLKALNAKREAIRERRDALNAESSAFETKLKGWLDAKATLDLLAKERSSGQELADALTEIARVASGNLVGADKRTFESFLQMSWFTDVVQQANLRLQVMSEKRFRLVARTASRSQGSKSGLDIDVYDAYTGTERAADTLSGGETFMASLALALGLSDVVSSRAGGSEVDCLFVDEGFGSLDDAALSQAVRTLTNLSGDKRLIGIISHVGELKQAISRQLLVEKRPEGSRVSWYGL